MRFNSLKLRTRMRLLVGVFLCMTILMLIGSGLQKRRMIFDARDRQVVTAVQSSVSVVRGYQALAAAGKMSVDDAKKGAREAVRQARYGDDGKSNNLVVVSYDGVFLVQPTKVEWEGKAMLGKLLDKDGNDAVKMPIDAARQSADGTAFLTLRVPRPGTEVALSKHLYVSRVDGWDWVVFSGVFFDDVESAWRRQMLEDTAAVLVVLLIVGGIGTALLRSVLREIGGEPRDAIEAMAQVAQGNLDVELGERPPGSMLACLAQTVLSLRQTVGVLRVSATNIGAASGEIAVGNLDLSRRTEQTASNLQQTASSMSQLTGAVQQSADAASQANQLAVSASSIASRGGEVVSRVVTTMNEINTSSKRIADIIGVIDGIAFQTNILALNAAVESARAGEQGRGFAVVAGEVRSLAQRSADAAKEIKSLIAASVENVETGAHLVRDAGSTMQEIVASVQRVSDMIGEISAASREQGSGLGQVNDAVAQLDQMTQQNAALVEESAAAADSLQTQARQLSSAVSAFRMR